MFELRPNCGGGFTQRPIRPVSERRTGVSLTLHPACSTRINTRFSREEIESFVAEVKDIAALIR